MSEEQPEKTQQSAFDEKPIDEVEPRQRLGTLLRRYRAQASPPIELGELAEHLGVPQVNLGEVERGLASLKAEQLQKAADYLKVRYAPLLEAARDWNRAVFEERGRGGVELTETTVTERALHGGEEMLERELIRAADDLAFVENVARELMVKAGKAARRARALLYERGVPVPDAPEEVWVECSGPAHDYKGEDGWQPHKMRLGVDFVLSYQEPAREGEERPLKVYFCSDDCAHDYRVVHGIEPPPEDEADDP